MLPLATSTRYCNCKATKNIYVQLNCDFLICRRNKYPQLRNHDINNCHTFSVGTQFLSVLCTFKWKGIQPTKYPFRRTTESRNKKKKEHPGFKRVWSKNKRHGWVSPRFKVEITDKTLDITKWLQNTNGNMYAFKMHIYTRTAVQWVNSRERVVKQRTPRQSFEIDMWGVGGADKKHPITLFYKSTGGGLLRSRIHKVMWGDSVGERERNDFKNEWYSNHYICIV